MPILAQREVKTPEGISQKDKRHVRILEGANATRVINVDSCAVTNHNPPEGEARSSSNSRDGSSGKG